MEQTMRLVLRVVTAFGLIASSSLRADSSPSVYLNLTIFPECWHLAGTRHTGYTFVREAGHTESKGNLFLLPQAKLE